MRIGLVDIDGHNFPNLALMKISAYHKSIGDTTEWVNYFNQYDKVYKSKVFTFTQDDLYPISCDSVISGGTGYNSTTELPKEIDSICPDYKLYPNLKSAYGFLTRGCPNKCSWCVVPRKEGEIRPYADIDDFLGGMDSAVLMDNNVLASDWGIKQIEKIAHKKIKIDFNQGLDARLIDKPMAKLLAKVRWLSPLRMSCDTDGMLDKVLTATNNLREFGCKPSNYFIYVLVTDIDSGLRRVVKLNESGLDPFAQPYIDFSGKNKVTKEQKKFARWVNHKAIFRSVEWVNYR